MLIVSRRNYLVCFERFAGLGRGAARCLLLRLRLVAAQHLFVALPLRIRFSRLQLIDRISFNRTSQSSICDVNAAWVEPRAVNKWNCVFAARIVFNEFDSA